MGNSPIVSIHSVIQLSWQNDTLHIATESYDHNLIIVKGFLFTSSQAEYNWSNYWGNWCLSSSSKLISLIFGLCRHSRLAASCMLWIPAQLELLWCTKRLHHWDYKIDIKVTVSYSWCSSLYNGLWLTSRAYSYCRKRRWRATSLTKYSSKHLSLAISHINKINKRRWERCDKPKTTDLATNPITSLRVLPSCTLLSGLAM